MLRVYRIIEIQSDGVVVLPFGKEEQIKLPGIRIPKFAKEGDLIRWCEHKFYDVIDENGDLVFR
ncbi:MAG TPA: hypothetical protein VL651_15290 [Bacteroidia bacterium]|jgi:hypothetical protein|nr:hypothetical protein [Bacteroidia bacterium]